MNVGYPRQKLVHVYTYNFFSFWGRGLKIRENVTLVSRNIVSNFQICSSKEKIYINNLIFLMLYLHLAPNKEYLVKWCIFEIFLSPSQLKKMFKNLFSQKKQFITRFRWFWADLRKNIFFEFFGEILEFGSLWGPYHIFIS